MSTMAGTISTNCLYLCRTMDTQSAEIRISRQDVSGKRRREFCIDGWLLTRGIPSRFSSGLVVRMKLLACPKIRTTSVVPLDPNNPWKNGGFFRPPNMGYISSLKMKVMGSHNLISIVLKCCFVFYWCLLEFFRSTVLLNNRHRTKLQQI